MSSHNINPSNITRCSFNFELYEGDNIPLTSTNRSFLYGDGLFETLFYRNGKIEFLEEHLNRLHEGLSILDISCPELKDHHRVREHLNELLSQQHMTNDQYRIKIIAWRKEGGLFTPDSDECDILILIKPSQAAYVGFTPTCLSYNENPLFPHSLSPFKRTSSLHYIYAGLFQKKKKCDDVLLMTKKHQYYVSECLYSNIFWIKDSILYTPSLETGCINGIIRQQLLSKTEKMEFTTSTGLFPIEDIRGAEHVFSANSAGLKLLQSIDGYQLNSSEKVIQPIAEEIFFGD